MSRCRFFSHFIALFCVWGCSFLAAPSSSAQVSVLSYHNDLASTGQNLQETRLTPAGINFAGFGKIYAASVDGQIYAQPLYVPGVGITSGDFQGTHNALYVATQHNSLYAFDSISGAQLWRVSVVDEAGGETAVPVGDTGSADISPEVGVTSTPVISPEADPITGQRWLYLVAKSRRIIGGVPHFYQRLHAIDIANGQERPGSPVTIAETVRNLDNSFTYVSGPSVAGTGDGAVNGQLIYHALRQHQRCGLSLVNGKIYLASASHGDNGPYHGWVLGYDAATLQLSAVFNATPSGSGAGIWMGGGVVSADADGALYCITGNGTFGNANGYNTNPLPTDFDANNFPLGANYGNTFLKLVPDGSTAANPNANGWGLRVADYFCPFNQKDLNNGDVDLGSGGVLILPDAVGSAAHPHLLVGAGKEGRVYLIDRDNMGKFRGGVANGAFQTGGDQVVQVTGPNAVNGALSTPAYFDGKFFLAGAYSNDHGKAFSIGNGVFSATPIAQTPDSYGYLGSTPSISANGANNGIVWCIDRGSNQLRAYDANNFNRQLYHSGQGQAGRDRLGTAVKFGVPIVADGLVFVGTSEFAGPSALVCYGQYSPPSTPPAQPFNLYAQTISGGEIDLFWTDNADNETGYEVYVSLDPNAFSAAPYATTAANATAFAVTGLQVSTTYYFRVRAINTVGNSAFSNTSASTSAEAPPVNFSNGFSGRENMMTFNGFSGAAIVGAVLRLTDNSNINQARSAWLNTAQNISQFSTEFTFRITDPNADGFTFAIQRAGLNARGSSGSPLGFGEIGSGAAVKFDIYPSASTTGLYLHGAAPDDNPEPTANSSGSISTVSAGVDFRSTHVIKVTLTYDGTTLRQTIADTVTRQTFTHEYTVDLAGVLGGASAYVGFTASTGGLTSVQDIQSWSFTPFLPTAPTAPAGLTAAAVSGTQINLAWTDQSDNETGFRVERQTGGQGSFAPVGSVGANIAMFIDANLLTDTSYAYRVIATNSVAESSASNVAAATTPIAPTTPSGAIATRITARSIEFLWNDNSNNETGFRILRQINDGEFFILATVPPNTTSYQDTGLQPDTDYDYHIQAFNAAGYVDFTGFSSGTLSEVNLVASDASAQAGTSNGGAFAVRRSNARNSPLTVNYTILTGAGQAAYGTRYTLTPAPTNGLSGSVTIPAGAPAATITLQPLSDGTRPGTQDITLTLAPGAGYATVSGGETATVQLLDDPAPVPTPTLIPTPTPTPGPTIAPTPIPTPTPTPTPLPPNPTPTPVPTPVPTPTPTPTPIPPDPIPTPTPTQATPAPLAIFSLSAYQGGGADSVGIIITGSGFQPGATVSLTAAGAPEIRADAATPGAGGASLAADFNLSAQRQGIYDLVVVNPDGQRAALNGAFTVAATSEPGIYVNIIGRAQTRAGRPQVYSVLYGNTGNTDALGVPLTIAFPKYLQWKLLTPLATPPNAAPGQTTPDYRLMPIQLDQDPDVTILPLFLPKIRAGESGIVQVSLTAPADPQYVNAEYTVQAVLSPPLFENTSGAVAENQAKRFPNYPPLDCFTGAILNGLGAAAILADEEAVAQALRMVTGVLMDNPQSPVSMTQIIVDAAFASAALQGGAIAPETAAIVADAGSLYGNYRFVNGASQRLDDCNQAFNPGGHLGKSSENPRSLQGDRKKKTTIIQPADEPNALAGSEGDGSPARYLSERQVLGYAVYFENPPTAIAPTQRATVTASLNPSQVDLGAFGFGPIGFGGQTVIPPPGQSDYSTLLDLRPHNGPLVAVTAHLEKSSGQITWTFEALAGFLPPNAAPPKGDGFLTFTVKPRPGLSTSTAIGAQASVAFDGSASVPLPVWINTLDNDPPFSQLAPLPQKSRTSRLVFDVNCTDAGSGSGSFLLYASENGGEFQLRSEAAAGTPLEFIAATDRRYEFFVRGRDASGNLEPLKNSAETSVRIVGPDLIGVWKKVSATVTASGKHRLKGTLVVRNQSALKATKSGGAVRFYLSDDATLDDGDTPIGKAAAFDALEPGGKARLELTGATLPASVPVTGRMILAVIDAEGAVTETDKENNTVASSPLP